ncbi:MAG: DNA gyrase inhibitor YacG [Giesbergeria sp.]|nr:DNA gyrase inhibitor YacG [Giesbergeria sp.]
MPSQPPTISSPARQVACPACRGPSLYSTQNPWRPFCSERCKQMDLGAWASEGFRVPAETPPDEALRGDLRENFE